MEVEEYIRRENWPAIPHDIMKVGCWFRVAVRVSSYTHLNGKVSITCDRMLAGACNLLDGQPRYAVMTNT